MKNMKVNGELIEGILLFLLVLCVLATCSSLMQ